MFSSMCFNKLDRSLIFRSIMGVKHRLLHLDVRKRAGRRNRNALMTIMHGRYQQGRRCGEVKRKGKVLLGHNVY